MRDKAHGMWSWRTAKNQRGASFRFCLMLSWQLLTLPQFTSVKNNRDNGSCLPIPVLMLNYSSLGPATEFDGLWAEELSADICSFQAWTTANAFFILFLPLVFHCGHQVTLTPTRRWCHWLPRSCPTRNTRATNTVWVRNKLSVCESTENGGWFLQ